MHVLWACLVATWSTGLCLAQFHVTDDLLTIDPRIVRRVAFGDCTFAPATTTPLQQTPRLCFPADTTIQMGTLTLTSGTDQTVVVRDAVSGEVVWRCLSEGRCLLGDYVPPSVADLAPNTLTVVGRLVAQHVGAWTVHAEWHWDTMVLQTVCLIGGTSVCGTRIGPADDLTATAVILLSTGQVVIDNGVSAAFVLASLSQYTVITQTVVRAAVEQPSTMQVAVARAPVTGEVGVLTCTVYSAPSTCDRFRWRQSTAYVIPNDSDAPVCLSMDDTYAFLAEALEPTAAGMIFSSCHTIDASTAAGVVVYHACPGISTGCTSTCAGVIVGELELGTCYPITAGSVRCVCADAT